MDADTKALIDGLTRRLERAEAELRDMRVAAAESQAVGDAVARVNRTAQERTAANYPAVDPSLMTGARNPDVILARLRQLSETVGEPGAPGEDGTDGEAGGPGSLGSGWGGQNGASKLESLRQAVCAILGGLTGGSISAECNGDGTITVTMDLPDLPTDLC